MLVRPAHFGVERRMDAREYEPAASRQTLNQDRCHFNQWSCQDIRNYNRPVALHHLRTAEDEFQPVRKLIEPRVLSPRLSTHWRRCPGRRLAAHPSSEP